MKVVINTNNKNYTHEILEKLTIHFCNRQCKKITLKDEKTIITIDAFSSYYANRTVEVLKNFVAHNFNNEVSVKLVEG